MKEKRMNPERIDDESEREENTEGTPHLSTSSTASASATALVITAKMKDKRKLANASRTKVCFKKLYSDIG